MIHGPENTSENLNLRNLREKEQLILSIYSIIIFNDEKSYPQYDISEWNYIAGF